MPQNDTAETSECDALLLSKMSKLGGDYEQRKCEAKFFFR